MRKRPQSAPRPGLTIPAEVLSPRELETVRRLALGDTNREIASALGISVKTIDTPRSHAIAKLVLRNNSDLTRWALHHHVIELGEGGVTDL